MFLRVSHTRVCMWCLPCHHITCYSVFSQVSTIQYPIQHKREFSPGSFLPRFLLVRLLRLLSLLPFFFHFLLISCSKVLFKRTIFCVLQQHTLTHHCVRVFVGFLFLSTLNIAAATASVSIFRYFSNLWLVLFLCCDCCGVFWLPWVYCYPFCFIWSWCEGFY